MGAPVQGAGLDAEQEEGREGWQVLAGRLQHARHEAARGPRAPQEDPCPPWSAHQDDRPQGPHRRCVQEEGLDIFAYVATTTCCRSALVVLSVLCTRSSRVPAPLGSRTYKPLPISVTTRLFHRFLFFLS